MAVEILMGRGKYKGLTKRAYKKQYGSSTPGTSKSETCHATGLDKALCKYPRSIKTNTGLYFSFNLKKDRAARRSNTYFQRIQSEN